MELCDHFPHRGCFPGAGCAGDVDAAAAAGSDGGFEVGVDGGELGFTARKRSGHGGDMKVVASYLVWSAVCMGGREEAGG